MLTTAKGRELVAALPRHRVLTETDGPFATRNGRPLIPRDVADTTGLLAELWAIEFAEAESKVAANMRELLASQAQDVSPVSRMPPGPQLSLDAQ
jgi:TatD DNase family protein